jgi:hypothetical protein
VSGDPRERLVVVGGPALSQVDTRDLRAAVSRLADAATALGAAAGSCLTARTALDRAVWTPTLDGPDPARAGRLRWAGELTAEVADVLGARARQSTSMADRLLVAAGLYRQAESAVEQLVGALVVGATGYLSHAVTRFVADPVAGWPLRLAGKVALGLLVTSDAEEGAGAGPGARPTAGPADVSGEPAREGPGLGGGLLRAWAPFADEALAGSGFGVALGVPLLSGGDLSVTGGARVLSTVVDSVLPDVAVEIEEVAPEEFTQAPPAWAERPARTVAEALARMADLYPLGSGVPDREPPGAPPGTVAVQQVTDADGAVSWLVVVPGTQELLSQTNPFDVDTDLDLMARETADVMVGVEQALAASGAAPDEPVVLVGHSLGGIAVTALASSERFQRRFELGGVITAGAPTATFTTPPRVPVLHLENTEELVSSLDGRSTAENPATVDRVTVGRHLADSSIPADVMASTGVVAAHQVGTHLRTLHLATGMGEANVMAVKPRIERHLDGERAETRFYRIRRVQRDEG